MSLAAALSFAAATMGWFQTRCRWWEIGLLLVATFMLFRPNFFMDKLYLPYEDRPGKELFALAEETPADYALVMVIEGTSVEGDDIRKTVAVQLGKPGEGRQRLGEAGLTINALGDELRIVNVRFGTRAKKSGFEQGWKVVTVKLPADRPSEHWVYLPALALVAFVWFLQRSRIGRPAVPR